MLKDHWPCYLKIDEAREFLAELGVEVSRRQMQRAAERDASGRRRLPFFVDPIDGRLKIDKGDLLRVYRKRQVDANNNLKP